MAAPYRAKSVRISGAKEIKQKLADVNWALTGQQIYAALGDAMTPFLEKARANAHEISTEVALSIYIAAQQPPSRPTKKTALVVVHKQDTMRRWTAARNNKSPRAKVAPGKEVAESLASMFELGTSRMPARPFFRPALDETKAEVVARLKANVNTLVEAVARMTEGASGPA